MWIDSHCHIYEFSSTQEEIQKGIQAGVKVIVGVSVDLDSMKKLVELRERWPKNILLGLGIHPDGCHKISLEEREMALDFMEKNLEKASMIGEVGLDYKWATTEEKKASQQKLLERQIAMASERRLPLNLHSRRALRPVMERAIAYKRETGLNAQLHWFAHSKKLLALSNQEGIYVSVGPSVLSSSQALHVAETIAPHLLLLETDGPVSFGGESANPSWIPQVGRVLAPRFGCSPEELASRVAENFDAFLGVT